MTIKGRELGAAVRELLETHPDIKVSTWGHTKHSLRFHAEKASKAIALEPDRVRFQNIWVTADAVDLSRLSDIQHEEYQKNIFNITKPNHSLFGDVYFQDKDLICFKVTDLWQAVRVIIEVAGEGSAL